MKHLFLLFCLLLSLSSLFAQSNAESNEKNDSTKAVLCSNAKGEPGFLVNKGNGHTEFKSVDQFVASQSAARSKNNGSQVPGKNSAMTKAGSSSQNNVAASANAVQKISNDSSALANPSKRPSVLAEGPPRH